MIREAEGYKEERVLRAQGDVVRFKALLGEYQKSKEVTWNRLQFETLERILPKASKLIIDPQTGANAMPLIPVQNAAFLDAFKDKTVIVFSLPGAFTPTCSSSHLMIFHYRN